MTEDMELLKQKNVRLTPQRIVTYEALAGKDRHLTAEQIYSRVKQKMPAISFATVYAILKHYEKKGLVKENRIQFDKSCFEARMDAHHHFYCRKCKKIFDLDICFCETLKKKEALGHRIEDLQGNFYGLCRDCRKKIKTLKTAH